jgi:hypothetical protein
MLILKLLITKIVIAMMMIIDVETFIKIFR